MTKRSAVSASRFQYPRVVDPWLVGVAGHTKFETPIRVQGAELAVVDGVALGAEHAVVNHRAVVFIGDDDDGEPGVLAQESLVGWV